MAAVGSLAMEVGKILWEIPDFIHEIIIICGIFLKKQNDRL